MQVKELEIAGFKSFVERVKLNFKPGITALVGPNGCGKSNIMDAIRWIMGEHNARQLRGSKMEDLIFNGSETRKSTGLAEVSMVLSNANGNGNGHDHTASVLGGVTEIMLTRRLHRSGESEYFINKVPCRLKDIVEVFLDSGVGTKSYSIMEQGKVDFILSLKPDERRVLIEEAAGISKYRTRKKEALSKMESTKNNLARIKDILNEIQIQMRGLDLQVKRLKRHRNIREEIRQIDLQLAARRLLSLKHAQEQFQKCLISLRDEETQLSTQRDSSESVLQENKLDLTELNNKIKQLQEDYYHAKEKTQREENALALNEKELQTTLEQTQKIAETTKSLESELASTETERSANRQAEIELSERIKALEGSFKSSSEFLSVSKNRQRDIQHSIEHENSQYFALKQERSEINNSIVLNRRLHEELTLRIQKLESDKEVTLRTLVSVEEKKSVLERQVNELRALRIQQDEKIIQNRNKTAHIAADLQHKESEVNEMRDLCSSLNAKLKSLQELQKNLEGYNTGVRTVMAGADTSEGIPAGIICLLADVIGTSSQYEFAVEAALDRILQAIVIDTPRDAVDAIQYLRNCSGGRVSFITRTAQKIPVDIPAGATALLSVVTVKNGFKDVVDELLGDALLTDTLSSALAIWQSMHHKVTIVTSEGDVIDAKGILTGGSGDGVGAGLLKRNREIREFTEELSVRESSLAVLRSEKNELADKLFSAKHEFEILAAEKQRLDIGLVEAEKNTENAERELTQEQQKIEAFSKELASCSVAIKEHAHELTALQKNEVVHQEAEENKTKVIASLQTLVQQITAEIETSETSHADIRVDLASAQKELENVQAQLQRLDFQKQNAREKMVQLQTEIEAFSLKSHGLVGKIASAKERLLECIEQNRQMGIALEGERSAYQTLENSVNSHEATMKELQHRWEEIGPRIHEIERDQAGNEMHLEYLAKDVYDKYALPMHELPQPLTDDAFIEDETKARLEELQKRLTNIGDVNLGAAREYEELEQRYQHLMSQEQDLLQAIDSLQKVITKINKITRQKFFDTYTTINEHFKELFPMLFNGGKAYMQLTNESDLLETGIEVFAQPPGKKLQSLDLLSGGERALTVIALMFSIFLTKPTPFCLMDEIDAPLDDSNIGRFITHLKTMAEKSQFIIITHNKLSMQAANSLYGVTMEERGVSKIVSVELN
jgi:chromosome segregation protein